MSAAEPPLAAIQGAFDVLRCSQTHPMRLAMAGFMPRTPGAKVFCFFSSEKKESSFSGKMQKTYSLGCV
jgi:hypothetical protein